MMVRGFPVPWLLSGPPLPSGAEVWGPERCSTEKGLLLPEASEQGESWTVTQLMTFFLCLETVLVGACFCSSSSSVSLLMVMTLTVGLGVSGMTMVWRWRSRAEPPAASPQLQVTAAPQAGLPSTGAQRGGVFSFTRLERCGEPVVWEDDDTSQVDTFLAEDWCCLLFREEVVLVGCCRITWATPTFKG